MNQELLSCHDSEASAAVAVRKFSFHPVALPGSVNKLPRRRRYLVLHHGRGLRLVGVSDEKKQVLHAASLLLSARDALVYVVRRCAWSKAAQPPNVTWLD
jgi:hypothetical protein